MNLADVYPKPDDLVRNEKKTLEFLKDSSYLRDHYPELSRDADLAFYQSSSFDFASHIDVNHNSHYRRILFGGFIKLDNQGSYDNISYYMAVCRDAKSPSNILRKFHFDLALPDKIRNHPHPLFHLQYCGKLSNRLEKKGFSVDHMESWLSEPRLSYNPLSLALLLHCIFREFRDEVTHKIAYRPEWQILVKKNEDLLLRRYYKVSSKFFTKEKRKTKLFNDFLYVS